ncbi:MAG: hypothetical protein GY766_01720 [Herbaspirillum sp.]|uniref:hypothetical protein n=1 Tax=Herbaspirillum sp. TaxID=1890675 RepID=UPI0025908726|nr:hypothetical protein [Herbaspirillum sp.]MCP3653603.1 hypothetical protein [Herbaspirillum sp.]
MSDVPDKIWVMSYANGFEDDCDISQEKYPDDEQARYLLSTPAREHADELVEALEEVSQVLAWQTCGECRGYSETLGNPAGVLNVSKHLLAKIREASNE